ncbi:MAG TPA: galactose-1-phosphate uridylyltransferase [Candidatus Nanoarchaeia archaeon]|nr:galactose-1-phosphate uridylyltransferase [Candidatus Nanoarchaeia archaeon]
MAIIRKDYLLDRWVYYATGRKKRPQEFKKEASKTSVKTCVFCPKNENLTPVEIGRIEYKNSWKMRWFLNKFAAVEKKGNPNFKSKGLLKESNAYGIHEIVVETPQHKTELAQLPSSHIEDLFEVFKIRIKDLSKLKGIKYVDVFKNSGKDAGTSLVHSHSQIVALNNVPSLVMQECKASTKGKKCLYCSIIKREAKSKRKIFETKNVVAFAPFASRFNFEAWIFPKNHKKNLEEMEEYEIRDMAIALKKILSKLKSINSSYNFFLHYSPEKENLHFHIEITPRMANWGGFEISTDAIINSVLPEDAAKFYRS